MVAVHNMLAANAGRQYGITTDSKRKSTEKLSSGYRINRSADDAAGLSISEKMRWQMRGLNQASENIQDGISLIQVADGALDETHGILQRMRELSVQAANDTNTDEDRDAIQREIEALTGEVDRIAYGTSFNEEIYPLLGTSGEKIGGSYTAKGFSSLSNAKYSTGNLLSHLCTKGFGWPPGKYLDFTVHLDGATHSLEMRTMDGTTIFSGECWTANRPIMLLPTDYKSKAYELTSVLDAPNNYLAGGKIELWFYFDREVTVSEADKFFSNTIFTCSASSISSGGLGTIEAYNPATIYGRTKQQEPLWLQTGSLKDQGIFLSLVDATAKGIGITDPSLDVTSFEEAGKSIDRLDTAIGKVSDYRSSFGAQQNRLEHAMSVDDITAENTDAAESRIRDTDMAKEMVRFAKHSILEQAGQSMLAQANQSMQGILSLLV